MLSGNTVEPSAAVEPASGQIALAAATGDLVARAVRGERSAFEELARTHLRAAYSVALTVVGRPADAEDVAQDALLRAFERIETCREPSRFKNWLLQIVRNRAKNWLDRRRLRDVPKNGNWPEQGQQAASPEATSLLRALGHLGPVQREVVLLHDLEGWTHPEIADALGMSDVMSRQHLFHARRELRARLDSCLEDGG